MKRAPQASNYPTGTRNKGGNKIVKLARILARLAKKRQTK